LRNAASSFLKYESGVAEAIYVIHAVGLVYGVLKEIINYTQRLSPHWKKSWIKVDFSRIVSYLDWNFRLPLWKSAKLLSETLKDFSQKLSI